MEEKLQQLKAVMNFIKNTFIGKDEIVDLLAIGLLAKENAFLLGPPGTAKSALVRMLSNCIGNASNFEYLLTRFTEPNEIYGPFDIRKLKDGELVTNTEGMMPEASMVFLDEIFNANSAILNSLLMNLNERIFRRGKETRDLPVLMFVGASNLLPEDETLGALLDRFLIRIQCDYVAPQLLEEVLIAGWNLDNKSKHIPNINAEDIRVLQSETRNVSLDNVRKDYIQAILALRNAGVAISDRRAVKLQNLIAASAIICGRKEAILSDLWIMKHIWNTEEQIELLDGIMDSFIKKDKSLNQHRQALTNKMPNAEELMKEVDSLQEVWNAGNISFSEQNVVKDKLRYIQTRCTWIADIEQKQYLENKIDTLWQAILQTI